MSSPRIIVTRRLPVFMAHICSKCGFPVISVITIEAESQKSYDFSRQKAAQIASETAGRAIEEEIEKIENCRHSKLPLVGHEKKSSMIQPGFFCSSSFSGYTTPCPYCLHTEPWQVSFQDSHEPITGLKEENFPQVFLDRKKAEQWAKKIVAFMIEAIDEKRSDASEAKRCALEAVAAAKKMKELWKQLHAIPELESRKELESQLKTLRAYQDELGLLDLKRKKEIKTRINVLALKLKDLDTLISRQEAPIKSAITSAHISLTYAQSIAFGCQEEVGSRKISDTLVYYFVPNPIPDNYYKNVDYSKKRAAQSGQINEETDASTSNRCGKGIAHFCRKCGYRLLPGSAFCTKCGTKVEVN